MADKPEIVRTTSTALFWRARNGDESALTLLFERYFPKLRRWASGRLPRWARDIADTADMVQETLVGTFKRLDRFEPRRKGALHAYLRQAVRNRMRDEVRRASRQPVRQDIDATVMIDRAPSPLDLAIGDQAAQRYLGALARLRDDDQQAIVARVELGYSYDQIAVVLHRRSPDAARMLVTRALVRLAAEMENANGANGHAGQSVNGR